MSILGSLGGKRVGVHVGSSLPRSSCRKDQYSRAPEALCAASLHVTMHDLTEMQEGRLGDPKGATDDEEEEHF